MYGHGIATWKLVQRYNRRDQGPIVDAGMEVAEVQPTVIRHQNEPTKRRVEAQFVFHVEQNMPLSN
jgi:molybdopterin/thiamine biosynthesis adenylyltransferase